MSLVHSTVRSIILVSNGSGSGAFFHHPVKIDGRWHSRAGGLHPHYCFNGHWGREIALNEDMYVRLNRQYGFEIPETIYMTDLWYFYKAIGYDYKKKKFDLSVDIPALFE
jgi:hypothetical protein